MMLSGRWNLSRNHRTISIFKHLTVVVNTSEESSWRKSTKKYYFLLSHIDNPIIHESDIVTFLRANYSVNKYVPWLHLKMNKLIQNTGFSHIVEYIFTLVDEETLDICNLVCKAWNDFIENSKFLWTTRLRRCLSNQIRIREFGQVRCCEFVEAYPNWARGCSCSEATEFDEQLNVLDLKKMYILMKMYCNNADGKNQHISLVCRSWRYLYSLARALQCSVVVFW